MGVINLSNLTVIVEHGGIKKIIVEEFRYVTGEKYQLFKNPENYTFPKPSKRVITTTTTTTTTNTSSSSENVTTSESAQKEKETAQEMIIVQPTKLPPFNLDKAIQEIQITPSQKLKIDSIKSFFPNHQIPPTIQQPQELPVNIPRDDVLEQVLASATQRQDEAETTEKEKKDVSSRAKADEEMLYENESIDLNLSMDTDSVATESILRSIHLYQPSQSSPKTLILSPTDSVASPDLKRPTTIAFSPRSLKNLPSPITPTSKFVRRPMLPSPQTLHSQLSLNTQLPDDILFNDELDDEMNRSLLSSNSRDTNHVISTQEVTDFMIALQNEQLKEQSRASSSSSAKETRNNGKKPMTPPKDVSSSSPKDKTNKNSPSSSSPKKRKTPSSSPQREVDVAPPSHSQLEMIEKLTSPSKKRKFDARADYSIYESWLQFFK